MPERRIKADLQKRAAISGLFLLFSLNSGCSYWPSQIRTFSDSLFLCLDLCLYAAKC